ncbi:hypothetical protein L204_106280 [Cryptococcus depauperatus]|nr:hypothetical protein L204_05844 [Cryptococcus depauperatus CBS 7855]
MQSETKAKYGNKLYLGNRLSYYRRWFVFDREFGNQDDESEREVCDESEFERCPRRCPYASRNLAYHLLDEPISTSFFDELSYFAYDAATFVLHNVDHENLYRYLTLEFWTLRLVVYINPEREGISQKDCIVSSLRHEVSEDGKGMRVLRELK